MSDINIDIDGKSPTCDISGTQPESETTSTGPTIDIMGE